MSSSDERHDKPDGGVSRRSFLKGTSVALTIPLVAKTAESAEAAQNNVPILGPDKVNITLNLNGTNRTASVEPRATLLDTLRNDLDLTGAKRVCDRATCGACTMVMDGKTVYACTVLAIEAQGKKIQTIEGLEQNGKLHPVQQAFIDNDAQQCGFCTPGFVMSCKALLDKHPNPTPEQIEMGVGGNLCRCGTYAGIKAAIAQVAQQKGGRRNG
ncbi:MAG TPA: (2Fe-2S)-binding protein [Blastocatellia bacterium]|nr:(2Fe-2S)-binding protein [Blastocatellia bacterium]